MKKSLFKISALLLVFVITIGCCFVSSYAATAEITQPTITIDGNNGSAIEPNTDTTISLNGIKLSSVKGIDLTITAPSGVTFKSITGSFNNSSGVSQIALTSNSNYKLSANTIRIVSAFVKKPVDNLTATITLKATDFDNYDISMTAVLVNSSEAKFENGTYNLNNGSFIVGKTATAKYSGSGAATTIIDQGKTETEFVPYGAVYYLEDGKYVYPKKNADGTFTLVSGKEYTYKAFKLPANDVGVTTFSSSKQVARPDSTKVYEQTNGIQFVSYALDKSKAPGTLVFKGDFEGFCTAKKNVFATKQAVINRFSDLLASKDNNTWYKVTYGDKVIFVARVPKTQSMWSQATSDGATQYALRVYNVSEGVKYTAVGYTYSDSTYNYSDEYQTTQA